MNYMEQIAQMLGVELEEEFYLEDITDGCYVTYDEVKAVFKLSNSGILRKYKHIASGWMDPDYHCLLGLFTGRYTIVKKPWKPQKNEEYYCVNADKSIDTFHFDISSAWDLISYSCGNCFRTKEEITTQILEEAWQKCYGAYFQGDKQDGVKQ